MDIRPVLAGGLASILFWAAGPSQAASEIPRRIGQCSQTTISKIGSRLEDGGTGSPVPDSGSAIWFANGGSQVSYEIIPAIVRSRVGDRVTMCLVFIPQDCPPGDDRGRQYKTTNLRTHQSWRLPDSQHSCGGA